MYLSNSLDEQYRNKSFIVVDEEEFTDEDVANIKSQIEDMSDARIVMERHIALKSPEMFKKLCKAFPGVDFFIKVDDIEYDVNFMESQVFDREEMNKLFENNGIITENGSNLYLLGYTYGDDPRGRENRIPFSKVIQANARMNNWVEKIKKAKVDGKSLTPFEKYLYAYQIVTQFKYTEDQIFEARDISRVLSSKFIVCAGYSSILSELCRRVGIVCKRQYIKAHNTGNKHLDECSVNHEGCIFYLKDKKYGIDGFFYTDPTLDSYDSSIEEDTSITFSCIDPVEYEELYDNEEHMVIDEDSDFSNFYFLRDAKAIPYEKTFAESETMLDDISNALKNGYFDNSFSSFMTDNIYYLPDPNENWEGFNSGKDVFDKIYINDKSYTVDEISSDKELMTRLALKFYSISAFPQDENYHCLEAFYNHSLSKFIHKNHISLSEESKESVINTIVNTAKTNEGIVNDAQVLLSLADYNDFLTIFKCGTREKFNEIMHNPNKKSPSIDDYKKAMVNVYRANGHSKEEAVSKANFMVGSSIWVADSYGWGEKQVGNTFASEAKRTKPIQTIRRKEIEDFLKNINKEDITVDLIIKLIETEDISELENIGLPSSIYEKEEPADINDKDMSKKRAKFNSSKGAYLENTEDFLA
ncbi:MAG: hypothetical protein IJX17_02145 [Clostridia bacterium]|nr:hypothetical protein [Clostridia bacterium]